MDIRQLSYFIEVARQKSFTKASQSIHLSQPTLSKMVKNLEEDLHVQLIDRSAKQIALTDAGEALFLHGQSILDSFDSLSSVLYDIMNLQQGTISIGIPPIVGSLFFPKIIKHFQTIYPNINIKLQENGAERVQREVEYGQLDMGVALLPVDNDIFTVIPFVTKKLMLFVHPSHPLAHKNEVMIREVEHERFILLSKDFTLHQRVIDECLKAGFHPKIMFESSQWDFISEMVSENLGIAILPETISNRIDSTKIVGIPIVNPSIPWHLCIILKKGKYVSHAAREFLSYIPFIPR